MGYINAIKRNNDILVWERNDGQREIVNYRAPYYFYTKTKNGEYTSIYGDKLERHDFATSREYTAARAKFSGNGKELFESDIQPELKLLSKEYYNVPAPSLHVSLYDIEVDYDTARGFSTIEDPYAPINSVAIYNNWQKRMVVYAVPPAEYTGTTDNKEIMVLLDEIAKLPTDCTVEINLCENEEELLLCFLEEINDSDVISGWNSRYFDDPYTAKRLERMGKRFLNRLSFAEGNSPRFKEELDSFGGTRTVVELSGRIQADYLLIFKKYEVVDRPSFKLEAIADEILIDEKTKESVLPKLAYEGSLADLYRNDFLTFMRYNLRDTEILKGFEDRLGYIELANQMYHMSTGLFKHVTGTIKLSELATINYCHHELDNLIVNDMHVPDETGKAKGAFVLLPQIGEHEWIGSIDINSLYPSVIRSNNISPEMIIGQFSSGEAAFEEIRNGGFINLTLEMETGEEITAPADEWKEALATKNWSISGFGTVFSQEKQGIMPAILEDWYSKRQKFQKLQVEAHEAGDAIKETYYDKLQYVYKIKLNSYYGSLLNAYFRFYDKRLGESTTATSRVILLHQCAMVTKLLDGKYILPDRKELDKDGKTHIGYSKKWSMLYSDTDSSYFLTHADNQEDATLIADTVGEQVNDSFQAFMQDAFLCSTGFDDIIKTSRENITSKGILIDKKRYILHIVDSDGFKCDKMKIMGVELKKTTLPKEVSKKLSNFIEQYLKGKKWEDLSNDIVDYKDVLYNTKEILTIGLPKGIKKIEFYTTEYARDPGTFLPGHVAAAIHYNECLSKYKDNESLKIISGMKIKVFYLKEKYGRFKSIAIPTDIQQVPQWFLDNFNVNKDMHIERLVDKPLDNIIKAISKTVPSRQSLLTDSLLGF